jgi:CBS domain-containing protein
MLNQPLRRLIEQDEAVTVSPQATVHEVAGLMLERAVGAVMVVDDGVLTGIFSERDVVFRVVAQGRDARTVRVREVMTPHPVSVHPDATLGHALVIMEEKGFRHLPVVENGTPIGLIRARNALDPELEEFVWEQRRREAFR